MYISSQHGARESSSDAESVILGVPFAFLEFFLYPGGEMPCVKHATARSSEPIYDDMIPICLFVFLGLDIIQEDEFSSLRQLGVFI